MTSNSATDPIIISDDEGDQEVFIVSDDDETQPPTSLNYETQSSDDKTQPPSSLDEETQPPPSLIPFFNLSRFITDDSEDEAQNEEAFSPSILLPIEETESLDEETLSSPILTPTGVDESPEISGNETQNEEEVLSPSSECFNETHPQAWTLQPDHYSIPISDIEEHWFQTYGGGQPFDYNERFFKFAKQWLKEEFRSDWGTDKWEW